MQAFHKGTEYAFTRKESCCSRPFSVERQVSGGLLPDFALQATAVMADVLPFRLLHSLMRGSEARSRSHARRRLT